LAYPTDGVDRLLLSLGLTKYEASAYLRLLRNKNVSAYELSKKTGIPSSRIYSTLNELVEKGFVIPVDSRPLRYCPRPPSEVFSGLLRQYEEMLSFLRVELQKMYLDHEQEEILAWNIHGRKEIMARAKDMIKEARQAIIVAAWKQEWRSITNSLKQAHESGVRVIVLAYGPMTTKVGEVYQHHPSDPSFREAKTRKFVLIADGKVLLFASFPKAQGMWSRNPELIHLLRDFVIHEIYLMKIKDAIPQQIEAVFGKDWEKIRLDL